MTPTLRIAGMHDADPEQYPDFVNRLWKHEDFKAELNHCALGIAGEAGEIVDVIKKHTVYGKDLDIKHLTEELGDLRYYLQALINVIGYSMESVEMGNRQKLNKRYAAGSYSSAQAIARADKTHDHPFSD